MILTFTCINLVLSNIETERVFKKPVKSDSLYSETELLSHHKLA